MQCKGIRILYKHTVLLFVCTFHQSGGCSLRTLGCKALRIKLILSSSQFKGYTILQDQTFFYNL